MHLTLLRRRTQVRVGHALGLLLTLLLRECKHHHGKQLLLLEQTDEMDPQRRIPTSEPSSRVGSSADASTSCSSSSGELTSGASSSTVLTSSSLGRAGTTTTGCSARRRATASGRGDASCFALLVLLATNRLVCLLVAAKCLGSVKCFQLRQEGQRTQCRGTVPWNRQSCAAPCPRRGSARAVPVVSVSR